MIECQRQNRYRHNGYRHNGYRHNGYRPHPALRAPLPLKGGEWLPPLVCPAASLGGSGYRRWYAQRLHLEGVATAVGMRSSSPPFQGEGCPQGGVGSVSLSSPLIIFED